MNLASNLAEFSAVMGLSAGSSSALLSTEGTHWDLLSPPPPHTHSYTHPLLALPRVFEAV